MAAPPSSPSQAALKDECPVESAQITNTSSYNERVLSWDGGQLEDEDVITITKSKSSSNDATAVDGYTISSWDSTSAPPTHFRLRNTFATTLPASFLDKNLFQGLPAHLNPETNALFVLTSTLSGTGLAPEFFDKILEPLFRKIGLSETDYRVVQTKNAESVKDFAQSELLVQANKGKKQSVLMLSGDGGMVDTINGLLGMGDRSRYCISWILHSRTCY